MPEVINVRYRSRGKTYYFAPNGLTPQPGDTVLVETSAGLKLGECVEGVHMVDDSRVVQPLRPVVRLATREDLRAAEQIRAKEKTAFSICEDKIRIHGLDMKLVDVEYSFEGGKILFFFTSDGRVDFRELVKDLASVFHTRIELRQIGVRDGAKMLGGLGICGRPFCCSTFLEDFQPVSIRMAKTQNLSLNPTKISGTCGRLMCCLKYEQDAYEDLIKTLPRVDASVDTPKGKGTVTEVSLLRRTVKVRLADSADNTLQSYPVDRLGYTIGGEYIEPKPEEEKPAMLDAPDLSLYMSDTPHRLGGALADELAGERNGERRRNRSRNGKPRQPGEHHDKPADRPQERKPEGDGKPRSKGYNKPRQRNGEHFQKAAAGEHLSKPQFNERPIKFQNDRPPKPQSKSQFRGPKGEGGEKKGGGNRRHYHGPRKPGGGNPGGTGA